MTSTSDGREAASLEIDARLLREARRRGVDLSRAAEAGIADAVRDAAAEEWRTESRAAIESSNAYVERHGLPLDDHRPF